MPCFPIQVWYHADHPATYEAGDEHQYTGGLSTCAGTGKISSTLLLEDEIEKELKLPAHPPAQRPRFGCTPIMYAYLTKGGWLFRSQQWRWRMNTARRSRSKKIPITTSRIPFL